MPFVPIEAQETPQRGGFIPLKAESRQGFTPMEVEEPEKPSLMRNVALNNPLAAAGETVLNFASQAVAVPVSGIAGIGAVAADAMGFDVDPAKVVHETGEALTYHPRGEYGQAGAKLVALPFEKLAEAGRAAGDKTLDVTGSPVAATAVDTAINALPLVLGAKPKPKGTLERAADKAQPHIDPIPDAAPAVAVSQPKVEPVITPEPIRAEPAGLQVKAEPAPILETARVAEVDPIAAPAIKPAETLPEPGAVMVPDSETLAAPVHEPTPVDVAPALEAMPENVDPIATMPERVEKTPEIVQVESKPAAVVATETKPAIAELTLDDVPSRLQIRLEKTVDGKTQRKTVSASKAMQVAQQRVERLQNPDTLNPAEAKQLTALTSKNQMAGMNAVEARESARQTLLDSAMKDQAEVHGLVREAMGLPKRPAEIAQDATKHPDPYPTLSEDSAKMPEATAPVAEAIREPLESVAVPDSRNGAEVVREMDTSGTEQAHPEGAGVVPEMANSSAESVPVMDMPDTPVQVRNSWAPGANYVSLGIDKPAVGVKLSDKPIRREDVLIPFMKALDTTLYEGRVKGKNRLGFYMPKLGAVRIKNKSDLEVAAHEIAHMIDDRVPEISQSWKSNKAFTEELRGVSYDKTKVYEGFAEYVRLKLTQPEQAKAKAPQFDAWFDDFTGRHEYGPAIRKAQEGMSAWFNQDALHRAQSKIGHQRDLNSALDGVFDRFRQSTTDDLHGLYRMERSIKGKTEPLGAYETARLTRGAGAMVDGAIGIGAPVRKMDGSFTFEGKGLQQILEPVSGELDNFLMYAVGRSSRELAIQGREHLFTPAEIKSMVALEKPEYRAAFNQYQEWNSKVLDFAEAHGIINPEIRKLFNRQQYLPFYRAGQPGAQASAGGVTGNWAGIKKLTGGDENLRPILGNMTQNAATLIEAALKNEARLKIVDLAKQKGGGKFLVRIEADSRPIKIDKAQVKDELLKAAGIDPTAARMGMLDAEQAKVVEAIEAATEQGQGFFEFMIHNQAPQGNVMAVLRNGKPEYYEIADPLLMRAVESLNRPAQNWLVRMLGWPKRIGQAAITLTPDFMVANLARDTIMAATMSKAGFRPFVDSVRGMASRIKNDPAYEEFIANGGGFASYLRDEQAFRAHLERFYSSNGVDYKTVLDTPDKVMYGLETIADAFEMSSRLGEYKRLREQGAHPRHAAYVAREISTDFAMRGDSRELGFLYDTVMFLRPAVVSMDRMARGLIHDENKGAIAAKAGTLALMSVGLYLVNRDKSEYQDLPDWDKDGHWHFFIPQQDGSTLHLRYPKIWEIGALASVSERTMGKLLDDEPELGKSVAQIVRNVFNLNLMPQIVAPLYEQATNRNGFTGAPIETPGMENVQPWLRAKPNTSETMRKLGEATRTLPEGAQIAPARAEALLRGYFNTWGMYGLMLTDSAFFGKQLPERRLDEMPVVRRFYEGSPAKHTKYESMFYDMLGEAERLQGTIRALDRTGRSGIADEFADDPASSSRSQLQRAQRTLQAINRDMNDVRISSKSKAQKRLELDALTAERNALLKDAVQDVQGERQ